MFLTTINWGALSEGEFKRLTERIKRILSKALAIDSGVPSVVLDLEDRPQPSRSDKVQPSREDRKQSYRGSWGVPGLTLRHYNGRFHIYVGPGDKFPSKLDDRIEKPNVG